MSQLPKSHIASPGSKAALAGIRDAGFLIASRDRKIGIHNNTPPPGVIGADEVSAYCEGYDEGSKAFSVELNLR
jgi:hypothetical protein